MIGFGVSFQQTDRNAYAAKVNGEVISEAQFRSAYSSEYRRRQSQDATYDRIKAEQEDLRRTVLDRMITTRLLAQKASKLGFAVDDDALRDAIVSAPYFQVDGQFNREQYERVLNSIGTSDREFENSERERMLAATLYTSFEAVAVGEAELWEDFQIKSRTLAFDYVAVPKSAFDAEIGTVTEADVREWEGKQNDVEAEVKEFYRTHKDQRYDIPKRACAAQILVRTDKRASDEAQQAARQKIAKAAEALGSGRSFAEVAQEYSEGDKASMGGSLGCFAHGEGIPAIDEAAFSLKPGENSNVIETGFGLHLIHLERFEEPVRRKLVEVEPEIKRELAARSRTEAKARGLAKEILLAAREASSLQEAIEVVDTEVALSVTNSGPLRVASPFIQGLGTNGKELLNAAWSLEADQEHPRLPVETAEAFVVFEITERTDADMAEFERQKDTLRNILRPTKLNDIQEGWQKSLQSNAKVVINPKVLSYGG